MITFTGQINGVDTEIVYDEVDRTVQAHPSIMGRIESFNGTNMDLRLFPYVSVTKPGDVLKNADNLGAVLSWYVFDAGSMKRSDKKAGRELPPLEIR